MGFKIFLGNIARVYKSYGPIYIKILGYSESICKYVFLWNLVRHKLWPLQNGMFSIMEIGKNWKKS